MLKGGTIAVGISDKKKTIEGFQEVGIEKINAFINVPRDCCKPTPEYTEEILDVVNTAILSELSYKVYSV